MKILNRAKSFYSDEYFISQDIKFELEMMYLRVNGTWRECEESTRSINFNDMLDSQGNKIFASLSEDGKGGDILESKWFNIDSGLTVKIEAVKWSKSGFCFTQDGYNIARYEYKKIIGIQK